MRLILIAFTILLIVGAGLKPTPTCAYAEQNLDPAQAQSFEDLYEDAEDSYADDQLEKALQAYKTILEKYPENEMIDQVQLRIAQCYSKLGEDALAIQTYQQLIAKDPNSIYASQAVSQIGNLFSQRYQFNEAIGTLLRIYDQFPKSKAAEMAGYLLGGYFYFQRMSDKATDQYKRFLRDYPDSVFKGSAINQLITIYINSGMLEEAESMLKGDLKDQIDSVELMQQLASIYQKSGKYDEAIKLYESALNINPNNSYLREKLGEIYAQKGDKTRALLEWSKLVSPNVDDYSRRQQLAYIYKSHGFYEEAEREYKVAISLQPKASYLYIQLADIYKIQNRLEVAADCYLKALLTSGASYGNRDDILSEMFELTAELDSTKLRELVIFKAKQALEKEPNSPEARLTLAEVEFFAGSFDEALDHFEVLAKIYPDQGALLIKYAQRLQRDGELQAAAAFFERAISLFSSSGNNFMAKFELAKIKRGLDHSQEAASLLLELLKSSAAGQAGQMSHEVYSPLGEIQLYDLKDPKAALSTFSSLQSLSPQMSQRYNAKLRMLECQMLIGDSKENKENKENSDIDVSMEKEILEKEILEVAAGIDPAALEAQKLLGDFYFFNERIDEASKQYQKAAELLNNTVWGNDAIYKLALIKQNSDYAGIPLKLYVKALRLERAGNAAEALKVYNSITTTFPKSAIKDDVMMRIGSVLMDQKRYSDSIKIYQELTSFEGLLAPEAQAKLADAYRKMGETEQALKEYSTLVEKYPDSVLAIYARGEISKLAQK